MKFTANQIIFLTTVAFLCSCGNLNREIWFKKNGEATMKLELLSEDYISLYEKCNHKEVKSTFIAYEKKALKDEKNKDAKAAITSGSDLIVVEEEVAPVAHAQKHDANDEIMMEEEANGTITIEEAPSDYDDTPIIKQRELMAGLDKNIDTIMNFGKRLKSAGITPYDKSEPLNKWNVHYINQKNQSSDNAVSMGWMTYNNSNIAQVSFDYKNKDELKKYYNEIENIVKQINYFGISPFENIYCHHNVVTKKIDGAALIYNRDNALIDQVNSMNDKELDEFIKQFSATTNNLIIHLPGKLKNVTGTKYKVIDESTIMITTDMVGLFRNGKLPAFTVSYF